MYFQSKDSHNYGIIIIIINVYILIKSHIAYTYQRVHISVIMNALLYLCMHTYWIAIAFCYYTDRRPTMPDLTVFPGKSRHFNIATEIGMQYYIVGTALLNDERGAIVPAIVSEHRGNAEQINMDILSCWILGKGISDRTWWGLLGVLRVHCPGLAQDIEETQRAKQCNDLGMLRL